VIGQLRVMVLDTSPTSRKILEVILRREGHQVACFADSLEALRFLSRHGPPDLLFLGMALPKMDGFDVLKYLRGEPRFHSMVSIALQSRARRGPEPRESPFGRCAAGGDEAAGTAADRCPRVRIPRPGHF
jgi:CheY-like chemotaxis protein